MAGGDGHLERRVRIAVAIRLGFALTQDCRSLAGLRKDKQPQIELQLCASHASATRACFDAGRPRDRAFRTASPAADDASS